MSFLPQYGALMPALYAFTLYGLRYLVFAGLAYRWLDPSRTQPHGRPCLERPIQFNLRMNLRRELGLSARTLGVSAAVNAALFGYGLLNFSQLYYVLDAFSLWWFGLSIPVMLVLHDTLFYWLHRALHTRWLFKAMHRPHHKSVYPTAFAAYSFGWTEALAEALIVIVIIFIIPVHVLAFLIFQTLSVAYNVYGHCGRELFPEGMSQHWLGRWLNTATLHAYHHRYTKDNYGLYFTFWDRAMNTLRD